VSLPRSRKASLPPLNSQLRVPAALYPPFTNAYKPFIGRTVERVAGAPYTLPN